MTGDVQSAAEPGAIYAGFIGQSHSLFNLPFSNRGHMLERFFGRRKKKNGTEPAILFGRYSDNNKPVEKVNRWTDADNLFKEKKYSESFDAFFAYLRDDSFANVVHERNQSNGRFHFYQGSKIVRGDYDSEHLHAEVTLAKMPSP